MRGPKPAHRPYDNTTETHPPHQVGRPHHFAKKCDQIRISKCRDVCWRSPEPGGFWYETRQLKRLGSLIGLVVRSQVRPIRGPALTTTLEVTQRQILSQYPTHATRFWWHLYGIHSKNYQCAPGMPPGWRTTPGPATHPPRTEGFTNVEKLKPRPESGLDCLICAEFVRTRPISGVPTDNKFGPCAARGSRKVLCYGYSLRAV